MIRAFHRWPGLLAAFLLLVLSLSGAALSLFPAAERLASPQAQATLSTAELAQRIQAVHPNVEQIIHFPSGRIIAYWFDNNLAQAAIIDPATGKGVPYLGPDQRERWLVNLHRSLFLGDSGRLAAAGGAAAILVLALSGAALVARRAGGWRRWFMPQRRASGSSLHVTIARVCVAGLMISSATALWMTASTFDLLPDGRTPVTVVAEASGQTGMELSAMGHLADTPVSALRKLTFPVPGDVHDVYTIKSDRGTFTLDQGTGALLTLQEATVWQHVWDYAYMLHTGRGAALIGLVLGFMALGVPVMTVTGLVQWLQARRVRPRIRYNIPATRAETIILVASEGGSTWGFAATLHSALSDAGQTVHLAALSTFNPERYKQARRILILAATYGDGDAPACAKGFLDRLASLPATPSVPLAVLGFGDRGFRAYCGFAKAISETAAAKGWDILVPYATVNRQTAQDFAAWGRVLGAAMGLELELDHQPLVPATSRLMLVSRHNYGLEVQAPTAILRFSLPELSLWQRMIGRGFTHFSPGDLIGIVPKGSSVPRFYSLASGQSDGFIEIAVREHESGLCSGQLMVLRPGDSIDGFLRRNPGFHADDSHAPLILIGAGTGIGPLAGFVRNNRRLRPIHLFFGLRDPKSDFLYGKELAAWHREGRLRQLTAASSRANRPRYIQDALREEASAILGLIEDGARIMVCGGHNMAAGVFAALTDILAPVGLTPAQLKVEGRYVEDIY